MTLVVGVEGKELLVVGADCRGTYASRKEEVIIEVDRMDKLIQITPHVSILIYGDADFGLSMIGEYENNITNNIDGVTRVFREFRDFCIITFDQWFSGMDPKFYPYFGFMVAGLDTTRYGRIYRVPKMCTMDSLYRFAPESHKHGFASRGVTYLSTYLLNREYKDDLSVNDLTRLVAYVISETASVDSRVGLPLKICIIDRTGQREVPKEDIEEMIENVPYLFD